MSSVNTACTLFSHRFERELDDFFFCSSSSTFFAAGTGSFNMSSGLPPTFAIATTRALGRQPFPCA